VLPAGHLGDGFTVHFLHIDHIEMQIALGGELAGVTLGFGRVIILAGNAEVDIQPVGRVFELPQHIPQRERVFSTGDGDQNAVLASK
jgi:hypothetical protein